MILNKIKKMVNNLGINPNEWFDDKPHNPLDDMPIANGTNRYAPPEKMAELESNPRPEEEMADWFKVEKPDESDQIEEEKKLYMKKCIK